MPQFASKSPPQEWTKYWQVRQSAVVVPDTGAPVKLCGSERNRIALIIADNGAIGTRAPADFTNLIALASDSTPVQQSSAGFVGKPYGGSEIDRWWHQDSGDMHMPWWSINFGSSAELVFVQETIFYWPDGDWPCQTYPRQPLRAATQAPADQVAQLRSLWLQTQRTSRDWSHPETSLLEELLSKVPSSTPSCSPYSLPSWLGSTGRRTCCAACKSGYAGSSPSACSCRKTH